MYSSNEVHEYVLIYVRRRNVFILDSGKRRYVFVFTKGTNPIHGIRNNTPRKVFTRVVYDGDFKR